MLPVVECKFWHTRKRFTKKTTTTTTQWIAFVSRWKRIENGPDFVITYGDLHLFLSNDSPGCNIMPVVTHFWKWNDANQFIWLRHSKCGHTQTIYIANGRACMRPPPSSPPPSSSFWSHNNQLSHEMVRVHRINYSWRFLHCKIAWNIFQLISIIKARFQSTISLLLFPSAMEERKTEKVELRIKLQSL